MKGAINKFIHASAMLLAGMMLNTPAMADDVFFVGHSLINYNMPRMVANLAQDAGITHTSTAQIINGSPLQFNWDNSTGQGATPPSVSARNVIPSGDYEVLVVTEAVPLRNHTEHSDSNGQAANFYNLAVDANPSARTFLYETWHCINSGISNCGEWDRDDHQPWRTRLTTDLASWEGIADSVSPKVGSPAMQIIPGGQAMALLYDEILAGRVPGVSSIDELFVDDIHPGDIGNYYIALVQFSVIYEQNPAGLTYQIDNEWGVAYDAPSAALAAKLQSMAWQVVCNYSRLNISCSQKSPPMPPSNISVTKSSS